MKSRENREGWNKGEKKRRRRRMGIRVRRGEIRRGAKGPREEGKRRDKAEKM